MAAVNRHRNYDPESNQTDGRYAMMKKRILLILTCMALVLLSGCTPRLISEAEAKEAGLELINKVFDINETEATVTLVSHTGISYIDGEYKATGKEQLVWVYMISISNQKTGESLYRAEVNAETGVAYSASRSSSLLPIMTSEQHQLFQDALPNGDFSKFDFTKMDMDCKDFVRDWIVEKFDLDARILGLTNCGSIAQNDGAQDSFYVVLRDGTIYYINIAWPELMVVDVAVLNQTRPYEEEP